MRIFLDCTETYRSTSNSGIQRVVRNLINQSRGIDLPHDVECFAVIRHRRSLRIVDRVANPVALKPQTPSRIGTLLSSLSALMKGKNRSQEPSDRVGTPLEPRPRFLLLSKLRRKIKRLGIRFLEEAHPAPGDLFVILELGLKMDWPLVEKLRDRGVTVGGVVYDLEPVRNSQFFPENTVNRFPAWLKAIGTHYDFALTISQTVGEHLQQYYRDNLLATRLTNDRIVAFRLGSELDGVAAAEARKDSVRPELIQHLEDKTRPTLLNVGTIEPRKNHTLLLDAFDNALARGADVRCLIVGVIGWKCEEVVQRMQSHPERGRRLLVYHDLNDEELKYVYSQADALAYTTHAEGYGLPVTEAMLAGLPVIANDLPVLRETSGNQAVFLSPTDVEAWGTAFHQFALGQLKFPPPNDSHTVAISWRESTQRFLNQIIDLTNSFTPEVELSTLRAKSA